jgi:hypothetical protein
MDQSRWRVRSCEQGWVNSRERQGPSQNLDNPWNEGNLRGCELGKTRWVKLISRRKENVDGYKVEFARDHDAFPEPRWPSQSLAELIHATFPLIETEDHPVILRKIAAKQIIKVT